MPNWCQNTLAIDGKKEDVKRFRLKARGHAQTYNSVTYSKEAWGGFDDIRIKAMIKTLPEPGEVSDLSFHALFPVPEDIRRFPYDDGQANKVREMLGLPPSIGGYTWESRYWGVKWGASDVDMHDEEGYLEYSFSTPWGPPIDFLNKIAKDFPELGFRLTYEEHGMGFAGESEWDNGMATGHSDWEIEYSEEVEE